MLYSEIEAEKHYVGWSRVGTNIRYYRNDPSSSYDDGGDQVSYIFCRMLNNFTKLLRRRAATAAPTR